MAINGHVFQSPQFNRSPCKLEIPVEHNKHRFAELTVFARPCDTDNDELQHEARGEGFLATIADRIGLIFAKLNSEKALRESESRFRLLASLLIGQAGGSPATRVGRLEDISSDREV